LFVCLFVCLFVHLFVWFVLGFISIVCCCVGRLVGWEQCIVTSAGLPTYDRRPAGVLQLPWQRLLSGLLQVIVGLRCHQCSQATTRETHWFNCYTNNNSNSNSICYNNWTSSHFPTRHALPNDPQTATTATSTTITYTQQQGQPQRQQQQQ
jgi:hypothetical protein